MCKKGIALWLSLAMLFSFIIIIVEISPRVAAPVTIYVGSGAGNHTASIQDAIDNFTNPGDTVFVYSGIYYEHVVVNKTINLIGEDEDTTIIDGCGLDDVVTITSNYVNLTGFNIKNCSSGFTKAGLVLNSVQNCSVFDNDISSNNYDGINLYDSHNNRITNNTVQANSRRGIFLQSSSGNNISYNNVFTHSNSILLSTSSDNVLYANNIWNSGIGIRISSSPNNRIIGNNFTKNGIQVQGYQLSDYNSHYIPTDNLVNGKPVYYYTNLSCMDIDSIEVGQIIVANCTNFNISNLDINYTDLGIQLAYSSDININKNNFSYIHSIAILSAYQTSGINITNNFMDHVNYGARFEYSLDNEVSSNNFIDCGYPIDVVWSSGNVLIKNNNVTSCGYAINIGSAYSNSIFNNKFHDNYVGTWIRSVSRYNVVENNTYSFNDEGIWLDSSQHNRIENNNISNSIKYGITLDNAENITIENNNISSNNEWGISLDLSMKCSISNNHVFNQQNGIIITGLSSDNILMDNNITNNRLGVHVDSSSNNKIIGNNISNNLYGINLTSSSGNWIYHNNIIDNTNQAYDDTNNNNQWDNGYPIGGNYWSDYIGSDNLKGPNQDIPGSDGIGDMNYSIDADSVDNYPLMEPYSYQPLENYTILRQGWNLISIPLIQDNQSLTKVLEMIDGYYDAVQWYDITDTNDLWRHFRPGKPYGNDLFEINETMGFWIHITQPGDTIFLYNGTEPTFNQTIPLHPGWNLVGYPSLTSHNRTVGLNNLTFGTHVDSIWTYNADTQKWKEISLSDYFEIGRGYWVHAKIKCVWEVPL